MAAGAVTKLLLAQRRSGGHAAHRCCRILSWTFWKQRRWSIAATCSHERVERALLSLGAEELQSILDDQGQAGVDLPVLRPGAPLFRG